MKEGFPRPSRAGFLQANPSTPPTIARFVVRPECRGPTLGNARVTLVAATDFLAAPHLPPCTVLGHAAPDGT
jgi:hypothetical protein